MSQYSFSGHPYTHRSDGLDLSVDNATLDDDNHTVGEDGGRWTGLDVDTEWETVQLSLTVSVPEDVVKAVFSDEELSEPPGRLYLTVRSPETILRERFDVAGPPIEPRTYDVTLPLSRSKLRGKVLLTPHLVRAGDPVSGTDPLDDGDSMYASTGGLEVATGPAWTLIVDAPDEAESQLLDGGVVSFTDHAWLPSSDHLYHLRIDGGATPELWLNADHGRVVEVLHNEGTVGTEARLRDVALDQVQQSVWTQLLVRTAADADPETGTVRYPWQETVLELFGRSLCETDDTETAARELARRISTPNGAALLVEDVEEAVQGFVDPREQLIELVEEGLYI